MGCEYGDSGKGGSRGLLCQAPIRAMINYHPLYTRSIPTFQWVGTTTIDNRIFAGVLFFFFIAAISAVCASSSV